MRKIAMFVAVPVLSLVGVLAAQIPASAENPTCPSGSADARRAIRDSPDGYTGAITCFKPDGDVFYYGDTHSDGLAAGMPYRATDGLSHGNDYTYLWDTNGSLNGWESLNTDEKENTKVYYRACLKSFSTGTSYGCSVESWDYA